MDDGHFGAATQTASTFAQHLDRNIDAHDQDSLSVYGSLLLRGAVAAGQRNDRHTASTLLDEAQGSMPAKIAMGVYEECILLLGSGWRDL